MFLFVAIGFSFPLSIVLSCHWVKHHFDSTARHNTKLAAKNFFCLLFYVHVAMCVYLDI